MIERKLDNKVLSRVILSYSEVVQETEISQWEEPDFVLEIEFSRE